MQPVRRSAFFKFCIPHEGSITIEDSFCFAPGEYKHLASYCMGEAEQVRGLNYGARLDIDVDTEHRAVGRQHSAKGNPRMNTVGCLGAAVVDSRSTTWYGVAAAAEAAVAADEAAGCVEAWAAAEGCAED